MLIKNPLTVLMAAACVLLALAVSGCVCCNFGTPGEVVPTEEPEPTQAPTEEPDTYSPIYGTTTATPAPGTTTSTPNQGTTTFTPTPAATITPTPVTGVTDAEMVGYGTDKDTYNRGETATCYVDIRNIGEVPITKVDFIVNVYTPRPFIGLYHAIKNQTYSVEQRDIQPGETERVEIAVIIPESYQGISTAGDYQFDIVIRIGGKDIDSFSKDVKVV